MPRHAVQIRHGTWSVGQDSPRCNYLIITRNDQYVEQDQRRIYIVTQERLLDRKDIDQIDLLAIDEYYKLDKGRDRQGDGGRSALLNVALRRYISNAKQICFLGPTVAGVDMRSDLRVKFVEFTSDFSTVAVDRHDYTDSKTPFETLATLLTDYKQDKSLIFSKSPPAARRLAQELATRAPLPVTESIIEFADWLAVHYHPDWPLVSALRAGYGLHHGSVPRSVAQALVRSFNEGDLRALICTSSLIEGVNTSAKNVFVFDKKISNTNYDYFDFRNIAGRSGRMGHHFVGRIFLFHEPPEPVAFQLDIPALGDDAALPDSILVNLDDDTLGEESRARKHALFERSSLPEDLVRQLAPYGIESIEGISEAVRGLLNSVDQSLLWRGYVYYKELLGVFQPAWEHLRFNKGRMNAKEAAFHANRLRGSRSLRNYFDGLAEGKGEFERRDAIEKGFRALVAFDYAIPKLLIDMEALVNYHCKSLELEGVNYSVMARLLDNFFSHHWIKALDEYGVPIPLGRKLDFIVTDSYALEEVIGLVQSFCDGPGGAEILSNLERELIRTAIG